VAEMNFCFELCFVFFLCGSNIFCWEGEGTTGCSDDVIESKLSVVILLNDEL
jgi:hypothetical protein